MTSDLLKDLNDKQKQAVMINDGSLLVFAGAGSGKTRVITTKIAYAIQELGIMPWQILAVTFTNKACREMKERVASMIGEELADNTVIRTFHSFGVWILRKYGDKIGINDNFTIYDDKESTSLLYQCFPNEDKDELKVHSANIALAKEKNLPVGGKYYEAYEEALRNSGNVDFGDLIIKPILLLKEYPEIRAEVNNRFKYILVDEYQDTNPSQLELLQLIAGPESFICVVGDDDQSIYRFRSADVKTILSFSKHFPNTKTVVLDTNYRCSSSILALAKDVIDNNKQRQSKDLNAANPGGELPVFKQYTSEKDEADEIAKMIQSSPAGRYRTTAILYRTNAQSKEFENKLTYYHIPYKVVGDLSFYNREEVLDATALLKILLNPNDAVSFARLASKLIAGVGTETINKIINYSMQSGFDVITSAHSLEDTKKGLKQFLQSYDEIGKLIGTVSNRELVALMISKFGIFEYYQKKEAKEALRYSSRIENLNQFIGQFEEEAFAGDIEGLSNYLESRALDSNMGEDDSVDEKDAVILITMHRTKGLEFDRVFVTGLEENVFFKSESSNDDVEEERRLCYVAFTRAKKELYLSCCDSRFIYGFTSRSLPVRFVYEIKENHVKRVDKRQYSNTYQAYSSYKYQSHKKPSNYIRPKYDSYDNWEPEPPKVTVIKKKVEVNKEVIDFKIGDRVRHEVVGDGSVTGTKKFGSRDTIIVTFDNGKVGTYLKDKNSLEKI